MQIVSENHIVNENHTPCSGTYRNSSASRRLRCSRQACDALPGFRVAPDSTPRLSPPTSFSPALALRSPWDNFW
jgi:hypothetical protein